MRHFLISAILATAWFWGGSARAADEPAATREVWEGTLDATPTIKLRLVFNVTRAAGKDLFATMDSPDQGASGIKVDTARIEDGRVIFKIAGIGASFEGKLNDKGDEAVGTLSQGGTDLPLTLKRTQAPTPTVAAKGPEQIWEGKLSAGAGLQVRIIVRVTKTDEGQLAATLDVPDQGAKGLKVDSVKLDKETLNLEFKSIKAKFAGKLDPSGTVAVGEWTQSGNALPLTLAITAKPSEARRPQTPKPPYPYQEEDVHYENKAAGVTLAGTLTVPKGAGPFPSAILISGSGPQDRDETLFEHKPFKVLADVLTRRGIAVLRVDDRGVGGSSGSVSKSTSDDFAGDVLAGVAYLKSRPDMDPKKIGLIGHSEGGLIAPIAANRAPGDVAFLVLLAGTGLPGDEILQLQARLIVKSLGADEQAVEFQSKVQKRILDAVRSESDPKKLKEKVEAITKEMVESAPPELKEILEKTKPAMGRQLAALQSAWFRYFLTYDPRPALTRVHCPVLALVGEKDLQVPPRENLSEIEKALKTAGNERFMVKELPGLNHLFQTSKTGSLAEYSQIEETLAPSVLKLVGDWIVEQVQP